MKSLKEMLHKDNERFEPIYLYDIYHKDIWYDVYIFMIYIIKIYGMMYIFSF